MKQTTLNISRPEVSISPQTANTVEIIIQLAEGAVRIVAAHDNIMIEPNGIKVRVKP